MQSNNSTFKEYLVPSIVLICICLAVTLALAGIHSVTEPIIEANSIAAANEARTEVLPEGDGFTEYDGKLIADVQDCYVADNGAGMAITTGYKGFGGTVTVMVGIDANGAITGVKVTDHSETPGLGTKAADPEYLKQYQGVTETPEAKIKDDPNVDHISGATITSNAVYNAVSIALDQYQECGGVK